LEELETVQATYIKMLRISVFTSSSLTYTLEEDSFLFREL
jgi:hypothetical protein